MPATRLATPLPGFPFGVLGFPGTVLRCHSPVECVRTWSAATRVSAWGTIRRGYQKSGMRRLVNAFALHLHATVPSCSVP